ncbi:class I SAM-dependent methyltransferase [Microbacterium sp. SS28]|uniref:class I SAM-dependent methyltransferase n=1 Tax=Microbacterium sp. SS28 TaxID=2919948 RepID=UPI001FAAF43D|nr:class I SAM-dependent methyltransferase [Microbacterium sp. SS28]
MTFEVPAAAYDAFMGRYSIPLAEEFAAFAVLPEGGRALDVGCGPGALTAVLVRRFGETEVAAVDPSASFAAAAAARFPWADVRHGHAEELPFDDHVFAATLAQLVVHFMTDAAAGVREMVRVTRPGGVVAACVWDFEGGRAPQSRFFAALREATGSADDESDRAGAGRGQLGAFLREAGCTDVVEGEVGIVQSFDGFDDWWQPYTLGVAPAGKQLAALDQEARERVREAAQRLFPTGPFTVGVTAWAVRGRA